MYSGQFLEVYARSVHAQNLAESEQRWATDPTIATSATDRPSFIDVLRRRLEDFRTQSGLKAAYAPGHGKRHAERAMGRRPT
jgi:hypothetical protein